MLLAVLPPEGQPAVLPTAALILVGDGFSGSGLRVRFRQDRLGHSFEVNGAAITHTPATRTLSVDLSAATVEGTVTAAPWAAGLYSVEVALVPLGRPGEAFSNRQSVAIAPAFATAGENAPSAVVNGDGEIVLTLHSSPPVRARQTATLVVGGFEFPPLTPDADAAIPVFTASVPTELRGATHPLRLRVDGVDSLFIDRSVNPPVFAAGHSISIPA